MTVPARQSTPALLQVDAILARVPGDAGRAEVARYLSEEFPQYRWIGVYKVDGERLKLAGAAGDGVGQPLELGLNDAARGRAAIDARVLRSDATAPEPELAVPIRGDAAVVGVLVVVAHAGRVLDASDDRFLSLVAAKLAGPMSAGPTLRLL